MIIHPDLSRVAHSLLRQPQSAVSGSLVLCAVDHSKQNRGLGKAAVVNGFSTLRHDLAQSRLELGAGLKGCFSNTRPFMRLRLRQSYASGSIDDLECLDIVSGLYIYVLRKSLRAAPGKRPDREMPLFTAQPPPSH